jgi:hypothetical protein
MTIFITHTIRQPEIPTLLDSWVTNTASVEMLCPQKIATHYVFLKHNMLKSCSTEDWSRLLLLLQNFVVTGYD